MAMITVGRKIGLGSASSTLSYLSRKDQSFIHQTIAKETNLAELKVVRHSNILLYHHVVIVTLRHAIFT